MNHRVGVMVSVGKISDVIGVTASPARSARLSLRQRFRPWMRHSLTSVEVAF